jgi:MFS family permease
MVYPMSVSHHLEPNPADGEVLALSDDATRIIFAGFTGGWASIVDQALSRPGDKDREDFSRGTRGLAEQVYPGPLLAEFSPTELYSSLQQLDSPPGRQRSPVSGGRAARQPESPSARATARRYAAVGGLTIGILLALFDSSIVNAALPVVMRTMGVGGVSGVLTTYLAAGLVSAPVWGKLADSYGYARIYSSALIVFTLGSIAGGVSHSLPQLLTARTVQGLGGGGLFPVAVSSVAMLTARERRVKLTSVFLGMHFLAILSGPLAGGWITSAAGWRWIFLINIPLGLASFAMVRLGVSIPHPPGCRGRIDYLGAAALSAALVCILLSIERFSSGMPLRTGSSMLLAGGALLAAFVVIESKARHPILPVQVIRNRGFLLGNAYLFSVFAILAGLYAYMFLYLQNVAEIGSGASGVGVLPLAIGVVLSALPVGKAAGSPWKPKAWALTGAIVLVLSCAWLYRVTAEGAGMFSFLAAEGTLGSGLGMAITSGSIFVQTALAPEELVIGTAVSTTFRQLGSVLGVSVFGAVFNSSLPTAPHPGAAGPRLPAGLLGTGLEAAYSGALARVFLAAMAIGVVTVGVALFVSRRRVPRHRR